MKHKLDIVFEDEFMVAVNKPSGLLTIPDRFKHDLPNLHDMISIDRGQLFTVHRLDRQTSGGLIFAKDRETHRTLSQAFMDRVPEKYYVAIVDGLFREKTGVIEAPLTESMGVRGKMLVHSRGKESMTGYEVLEEFGNYSYVKLRLFTGRTHQIRVHLSHVGHPLVVDPLYGKRDEFFLSEIKKKKFNLKKGFDEKPLLARQPLHSQSLVIPHPQTEESLTLEFEPPKDINAVLKQFRKILNKEKG